MNPDNQPINPDGGADPGAGVGPTPSTPSDISMGSPADTPVSAPAMDAPATEAPAAPASTELPNLEDTAAALSADPTAAVAAESSPAMGTPDIPASTQATDQTTGQATPAEQPAPDQAIIEQPAAPVENLQPAAPVPGSIGSQTSYGDTPAATNPAAPAAGLNNPAAPRKKKLSNVMLLSIILGAVIVIAIIVIIILLISGSSSRSANNTPAQTTTTEETKKEETVKTVSLTCTMEASDTELQSLGDATKAEDKMVANYLNDELVDISMTSTITYPDADAARTGLDGIKAAYNNTLKTLLNLSDDPLTSNYARANNLVTVTHFAEADEVDEATATIFGLSVDTEGDIKTDAASVRTVYETNKYTCSSKTGKA